MNVKLVALVNGQSVICDLETSRSEVDSTIEGYTLKNASTFAPAGQGVAIVPMNPFMADEPVTVEKSAVVYVINPTKEVAEKFQNAFSELALPTTPDLVLPS